MAAAFMAALVAGFTVGCSRGLESLPLPAPNLTADTYTLHAVFANALNLPAHAKVKLSGADIGELESITARNYTAYTTLRIQRDTRVPIGSTAELRTATPLGDVFVSLKPPVAERGSGLSLTDGDTIGMESTSSAATVEAVLSSAALLVNGGAIRNLAAVTNGMGQAVGNRGSALADVINKSNNLMEKMNSRSTQFRDALTETKGLADVLAENHDEITNILDAGAPATDTLASQAGNSADLLAHLGTISRQLAKFPSIQGTGTRSLTTDLNNLSRTFNDVATHPDPLLWSLNRLLPLVVKGASGTAIGGRLDVAKIALGAIPDIGYLGDSGMHGPKRADWDYLVGSLRYQLFRLQERVVGQGPGNP